MASHIVLKARMDTPKVSQLLWVKVLLPLPSCLPLLLEIKAQSRNSTTGLAPQPD